MGIIDIFKPLRKSTVQRWKELGCYNSIFTVFGTNAYKSEIVRSCIRPLAEYSAKAMASCEEKRIEKILNEKPNVYMTGHDLIQKVRTKLELLNTAFIYIEKDKRLQMVGAYPVPYEYFEALEYNNGLFIKFYFVDGRTITLPWNDLVVLRKDYNTSDIAGDDNGAIVKTLELINTTNEGLANSIKATANLRGILKSTKAMLAPEAIKRQKDEFVSDYMNLSNAGGIAALDSTMEFTPINMTPSTASYEQMKEIRETVYRYFNVNEDFIMSNMKTEQLENLYKLRIEPFLISLSTAMSNGIGKQVTYMADRSEFMTISQKLELFDKVVLYGGMCVNEWRALLGYPPIEGGDTPIRRLDADYINVDESPRPDNDNSKKDEVNEDE